MRKKIVILGGGLTGLTASYYLAKKNYQITVVEKLPFLGGLAAGFKREDWDWYLDYAYHHLFANDQEIISFIKEIGFNKVFFLNPVTGSIFDNLKIYPMDNPIDFIKLPFLSLFEKIRSGLVIFFLKISLFLSLFEKKTSEEFIKKTMGNKVWDRLWEKLFRKKFGKYAENILASFFWARIKKRTKKLAYPEKGFQNLIDFLENKLKKLSVNILKNCQLTEVNKMKDKFVISFFNKKGKKVSQEFDLIISTLPTPVLIKLTKKIFPTNFSNNLKKLKYLNARTLILESKKPLLDKVYWLNVSTNRIPIMGIIEHTNFIDKKYFGGNHLIYLAWYVDEKDKFWKIKDEELLNIVLPYLKKINQNFSKKDIINFWSFKASYAQPIFDKEFVKYKPDFKTPLKNFYIANLDMTYPFDRGTNYAIKLGKEVSEFIK